MEGLVFVGPYEVQYRLDLPMPSIRSSTDAIVEVERAGLFGSDLHVYRGLEPCRSGTVMGHEAVGRVVAAGSDATHLEGARVVSPFTTSCGACDPCERSLTARCEDGSLFGWVDPTTGIGIHGMQATFVRVPLAATSLIRLPESVSPDMGVLLADNLPTAQEAIARTGATHGELLVVGLGSVGLCVVALARSQGFRVRVVDPVAARCALAERLGATIHQPEQWVDVAVEASGNDAALLTAVEAVRPGGAISVIAVQTRPNLVVSPVTLYDKNVSLTFGRASARPAMPALVGLAGDGAFEALVEIVTHPGLSFSDGEAVYQQFSERRDGMIKATFAPKRD